MVPGPAAAIHTHAARGAGPAPAASPDLPAQVLTDLRTDHAGETGAVCIYQGVLRVTRDPALRAFATRHLATEQAHLAHMEAWLPKAHRSRLLPAWRLAGWLTGALPAVFGSRAVYATVEAVERFVDHHYDEQVQRLTSQPDLHALRETLLACQQDEAAHRDEAAAARGPDAPGLMLRAWCQLVDTGSRAAVGICRHI